MVDKICKYEMDRSSNVENIERTRSRLQTDRWTDGQIDERTDGRTDMVKPIYPLNFVGDGIKRQKNSRTQLSDMAKELHQQQEQR